MPLKIVFILTGNECRNGPVNGQTLRGSVGGSGTDQTTILVAEHLAKVGHDVYIAAPNSGTPGAVINGVTYTTMAFDAVADCTFDVLVNTLWFEDFHTLPIKVTKALVSWSHCPYLYGFDPIKKYITENGLKYGMVHLSQWSKRLNSGLAHSLAADVVEAVIPNPLMTDLINEVNAEADEAQRQPRDMIFHAAWVRGGDQVIQTLRDLQWDDAKVHIFDYLMGNHHDPHIVSNGSKGKRGVLERISKCQYFLYPLVRHDGEMHKDTFACVVAEACAMGAIVVTYPVAALPETYNDVVHWLPFPDGVSDLEHLRNAPLSKDPALLDITHIKEAMTYLDTHPEVREAMRQRARQFVLDRYNPDRVGGLWEGFLAQLTS